jgi:hypothetical protein
MDCAAASRVLREIRHCLEASDVEDRLAWLEEAAELRPPWTANGADRRHIAH